MTSFTIPVSNPCQSLVSHSYVQDVDGPIGLEKESIDFQERISQKNGKRPSSVLKFFDELLILRTITDGLQLLRICRRQALLHKL